MQCVITRYLRLDRKNKAGLAPVHFRICWTSQKVRFSPKEYVDPKHWNDEDEIVKKAAGPSAKRINSILNTYTEKLEAYFAARTAIPSVADVQTVIDEIRSELLGVAVKKKETPAEPKPYLSLSEYIPEYINQRKADRSRSWRLSMDIVGRHLLAFRQGIDWPDLTLNTLNQFKVYLQEKEKLADGSLAAYIYMLRGMCKYALRDKCPVPPDYDWLEVRPAGDTIRPSLTLADIEKIKKTSFVKDNNPDWPEDVTVWPEFEKDMEAVRWYFLCACGTALRHSDWSQFLHPRIVYIKEHPCLLAVQQKTGKQVPVPLTKDTLYMLQNPVTDKPPAERITFTSRLKTMAKIAGLNRTVRVSGYKSGVLTMETLPLWQTLATHTGRRTYATIMIAGGLNPKALQEIMGHKALSSTQKYTNISNDAIVEQAITAWVSAVL
nr:tyrosine-type recombinase/integrase [uncultured Arsenicibacter sp.]